jgi:hypothetical protein
VLGFEDEGHRAVDDGLDEVCWYRLVTGELDTIQRFLEVDAQAGSMLADWGWSCCRLRPDWDTEARRQP